MNVSGDVAPCCIQGRPVVGNVHKESLAEIWNNEPMREMREKLLDRRPDPVLQGLQLQHAARSGDVPRRHLLR